ncbi:MAG: endoribonuclease MazF [Actinomycetota bacterium]
MSRTYIPDFGHVVWLSLDPRTGHEQAGRRPALVLTAAAYNARSGLMVCCPLTSQIKGYPFEVIVEFNGTRSAVLTDHLRSVDWKARKAKAAGEIDSDALVHVQGKVAALLNLG